ncbi:hypothetical protein ElyMa_003396900 [Elysia marginata]|uniref:Uncharacterized protein n=1 Tax=Elysia marginata TaxID=1093978 RepID=A0AAV4JNP8_9GAST|nr:hypothetical protein ElyMa_003396900 [Elysia marginata]
MTLKSTLEVIKVVPQKSSKTNNKPGDWSRKWLLKLHLQKCVVLKLGIRNKESEARHLITEKTYNGGDFTQLLPDSDTEKDLGVVVNNQLSFEQFVAKHTKLLRVTGYSE